MTMNMKWRGKKVRKLVLGRVSLKREEEEGLTDNAARGAEIVTTYNEGDTSSIATEPRSNNVSPNGKSTVKLHLDAGKRATFWGVDRLVPSMKEFLSKCN